MWDNWCWRRFSSFRVSWPWHCWYSGENKSLSWGVLLWTVGSSAASRSSTHPMLYHHPLSCDKLTVSRWHWMSPRAKLYHLWLKTTVLIQILIFYSSILLLKNTIWIDVFNVILKLYSWYFRQWLTLHSEFQTAMFFLITEGASVIYWSMNRSLTIISPTLWFVMSHLFQFPSCHFFLSNQYHTM